MIKRILSVFIVIITLLVYSLQAFAYEADEHDSIMEQVLFGDENYSAAQSEFTRNKVKMLEYASYLAIDQFNGKGKEKLDFLSNQGVSNLPSAISVIDFSSNSTHRSYTHRGWDYDYADDKANWKTRKKILLSTVNNIFDFGFTEELNILGFGIKERLFNSYPEKCNSFSALVYYIHILGDHMEAESYKVTDLIIPFVRVSPSETNPDIEYELEKHLAILFDDQKTSRVYKSLLLDLDSIATKARSIVGSSGGVNTTEKFSQYKEYEEDYMEILEDYIPLLLKKEAFFNKTFN